MIFWSFSACGGGALYSGGSTQWISLLSVRAKRLSAVLGCQAALGPSCSLADAANDAIWASASWEWQSFSASWDSGDSRKSLCIKWGTSTNDELSCVPSVVKLCGSCPGAPVHCRGKLSAWDDMMGDASRARRETWHLEAKRLCTANVVVEPASIPPLPSSLSS